MANLLSAKAFYRKASAKKSKIEDGFFINLHADIYGVTDGNSAAFSPSHPPLLYGGLTGAQMVNWVVGKNLFYLWDRCDLKEFLLKANQEILLTYQALHNKDPRNGDDVGGACFVFCQPHENGLYFLLGGDCFVFTETKNGPMFLTGFDKAAFEIETKDQDNFTKCKERAGGNIEAAWNLYQPIYKAKRIFCKNRNMGQGGDASLNGDPALEQCWRGATIPWEADPEAILLGTDGLLPPSEVHPDTFELLAKQLYRLYLFGGIPTILAWRDQTEKEKNSLTHIEGWPEAAAVELKFG